MNRPLQVYLDSSDYSRFGDVIAGRGRAETEIVLNQLLRLQSENGVQFRYSYIHIVEAAATEQQYVERAVERAKAIELLSGTHALIPWGHLVLNEAAALAADSQSPGKYPKDWRSFHGRRDDGGWFPSFHATFRELISDVEALKADPFSVVPETTRRALGPKLQHAAQSRKGRKLMQEIILRHMPQVWAAKSPQILRYFPLSKQSQLVWQKMFFGTATAQQAANATARDLADLPRLVRWMADTTHGLGSLPSWLRQHGATLPAMYKLARDLVAQSLAEQPISREELNARWAAAQAEVRTSMERSLLNSATETIMRDEDFFVSHGLTPGAALAAVTAQGLEGLPSQTAMLGMFAGNLAMNMNPLGSPRNLDKAASDLGDMAHGWYVPYVDVMRADRFAAQYLTPVAARFSTAIESDLSRLGSRVETEMRHRAKD